MFEKLPTDIRNSIFSFFSVDDLSRITQSNKKMSKELSEKFWENKVKKDFFYEVKSPHSSKETYKTLHQQLKNELELVQSYINIMFDIEKNRIKLFNDEAFLIQQRSEAQSYHQIYNPVTEEEKEEIFQRTIQNSVSRDTRQAVSRLEENFIKDTTSLKHETESRELKHPAISHNKVDYFLNNNRYLLDRIDLALLNSNVDDINYYLIDKDPKLTDNDKRLCALLITLCRCNAYISLRVMLNKISFEDRARFIDSNLLYTACYYHRFETAKLLIDLGANPNKYTFSFNKRQGIIVCPPLLAFIVHGNQDYFFDHFELMVKILDLLIESGAKLDIKIGMIPFRYLEKEDFYSTNEEIIAREGIAVTKLYQAVFDDEDKDENDAYYILCKILSGCTKEIEKFNLRPK